MTVNQGKSEMLGVLLIGFSPVVREGLQAMLSKDERVGVVGDALNGHEALVYIKRLRDRGRSVKLVLTETRSANMDGVQATRLIKENFPDIAVIVLTENLNDTYVIDAIQAGAGGYIFLKDMTPETLIQSIHRGAAGGTQMTTELLHAAV
jgi:DNA-binding NarL/FixJ family response regulator